MRQNRVMTVVGWLLTVGVAGMLGFSASMKFRNPPEMAEFFVGKFGYPEATRLPIAVAEVASAVLFLIPQTAVLGAVLLTGYLGGAIATHVRVSDNFIPAVGLGVVVWLALYLRDPRVRALLPWRSTAS